MSMASKNTLWVARDSDGLLHAFKMKPIKGDYGFFDRNDECGVRFPFDIPEITFENSPKKVELKLIEKWMKYVVKYLSCYPV